MNLEKFVKSPYRALVMVLITFILGFLGYHYGCHIFNNLPEKREVIDFSHTWLIPAIILAYPWCAAFIVSVIMILNKRPLKSYEDKGLIVGLIAGLIVGLIGEFRKPEEELEVQNQLAS